MAEYKKEYLTAGLTEEDFAPFYEFCKAQVARDISYRKHTQPLLPTEEGSNEGDEKSPLFHKFQRELSCEQAPSRSDKYWWIDEISSEDLVRALRTCSDYQLELIDLYVYQQLTQAEIGRIMKKSQYAISSSLKTVMKKLKKLAGPF